MLITCEIVTSYKKAYHLDFSNNMQSSWSDQFPLKSLGGRVSDIELANKSEFLTKLPTILGTRY